MCFSRCELDIPQPQSIALLSILLTIQGRRDKFDSVFKTHSYLTSNLKA